MELTRTHDMNIMNGVFLAREYSKTKNFANLRISEIDE